MTHLTALIVSVLCAGPAETALIKAADEPLLNWSLWEKHRASVVHPAATVKAEGLARARQNVTRSAWGAQYARGIEGSAKGWLAKLTPEFLQTMIPANTPGDTLFTPCPACRDLGKPWHPHGQWRWSAADPERLTCTVCGTVFPNEKYAENIVVRSKYAPGQVFTYCRAEPMQIFSYVGRPSFAGNIRARKVLLMAAQCRRLSEAYALSGNVEYARATRLMLLRFADVYPRWLVHAGYGEFADMDPHVAALNINRLPEDEVCPPPVRPDRRLHTGYWSAGRSSGVGMEAGFVRQMVESYEFVCQASDGARPLFSDAERRQIERDLLLESSVLLVADKAVNNKSVGNATAAALVGMSVGHPGLVRFGLDVFQKTVDEWFLADGGTSESWGYATMTLGGIAPLGRALTGYSDPPGYRDAHGKRIDRMDLYHQTAYGKVWEAMFNGLQGDLSYPPLADGMRRGSLGTHFVELMADNYPERTHYLALLKALAGDKLERCDRQLAMYERPAGLADKPTPPLALADFCYPVLQLGYLRGGPAGRDSTLILSASDWGGHHHHDSLNLYYEEQGDELLSDLGYLWDHPLKSNTVRTFAHNTVMVDGREQATKGRGGRFTLFGGQGPLQVMEAESKAYPQASLYRRTVAQVQQADGRRYVLDLFRVAGGRRHEYVFHGPNRDLTVSGSEFRPAELTREKFRFALRFHLSSPNAEIFVDDVEIAGPDGRNLVANPSGAELDAKTGRPAGWGAYQGDGRHDWGRAEPGRTDAHCVRFKAAKPGKGITNLALLVGESDGYRGSTALLGEIGVSYRVSFWLRGKAPLVSTEVLYWPGDPASADSRHHVRLEGLVAQAAPAGWTHYTSRFTLPGPMELENVRSCTQPGPLRLTWKVADKRKFQAVWPNQPGETSLLGDGWGQRDWHNTDVGALLPYIVRRQAAQPQPTVFLTAFESQEGGRPGIVEVRRLSVPSAEAGNTVLAAVQTAAGVDYFASCLTARPLTLATPDGTLELDARFAMVRLSAGKPSFGRLLEGRSLRWNGKAIGAN
jgi:hypothetical protein